MRSLEHLDTNLVINQLDQARREHYEWLLSVELFNPSEDLKQKDIAKRAEIKKLDDEICKRYDGKFVCSGVRWL